MPLSKKFFADLKTRYAINNRDEFRGMMICLSGGDQFQQYNWLQDERNNPGHHATIYSPVTCGIGELGHLYYFHDLGDTLIGRVLYGLCTFLNKNRSLIYFYMPKKGNFLEVDALLKSYGFLEKQTFYNPNSGNDVVQYENLLGSWKDYDSSYFE